MTGNGARTEQALRASELSYRRLFEAAKDGILILDVKTGRIVDVNPFLVELLGFSHGEMVGKTVGELSPFKDIESNQVMLERLQKDGYGAMAQHGVIKAGIDFLAKPFTPTALARKVRELLDQPVKK